MKIYVINLDRSPDRLAHIQKEMAACGLDFTRVEAIDGKHLDYATVASFHADKSAYSDAVSCRSLNEAACNLSHAKALELIAHGKDEYGVVLEDDAVLSPHAADFLKHSDWIPKGENFIKIDTGSKKKLLEHEYNLGSGPKLYRLRSSDFMAAGYIVSREAAMSLYLLLKTTPLMVDNLYYSFEFGIAKQLQPLQLYPAIVSWELALPTQIEHPQRAPLRLGRLKLYYMINRERSKGWLKRWLAPKRYKWGRVPFV